MLSRRFYTALVRTKKLNDSGFMWCTYIKSDFAVKKIMHKCMSSNKIQEMSTCFGESGVTCCLYNFSCYQARKQLISQGRGNLWVLYSCVCDVAILDHFSTWWISLALLTSIFNAPATTSTKLSLVRAVGLGYFRGWSEHAHSCIGFWMMESPCWVGLDTQSWC